MQAQLKEDELNQFRHKTLEERSAEFGGKLMLDGEYDWGEPAGNEKFFKASLEDAQKWAMSVGYNESDIDEIIKSTRKRKPE